MKRTRYFFAAHNIMIIHCGINNINHNQPEIMKTVKIFTKNNSKVNTITARMLPQCQAYSFRQTPIYETKKTLNSE